MKAYSFKLELKDRTIITHVYSETGEDIAQRFSQYKVSGFSQYKVSDIQQLDTDPTTDLTYKDL